MNRFNLTFRGEIVEGHEPERVRARLGQLLAIEDPALLQRCFSGDPVVLRRNLERKEAAELYARLRRMGIHVDLVKIGERGDLHQGESGVARATAEHAEVTGVETPPQDSADKEDTGRQWPAAPKTNGGEHAAPNGTAANSKAQAAIRRADLAARKELQADQDAELKAREKALKKALLLKEKEEARRRTAGEKAQKKTQAREARHKAKLAAARRKAELEQRRAEEARRQAEARAERLRLEAQERERREAEERERSEAQRAEQARQEAEAARQRAEEIVRRAREEERRRAREEEQEAQRRAMEEQAINRAATELAQKPGLRQVEARVKTRLETPSMKRRSGEGAVAGKRRKQPGAPNLYSLRPFRNTPEIRDRATLSKRAMRLAYSIAAAALVIATALGARLATLPQVSGIEGPGDMVTAPQGRLLLSAAGQLLLHDRAGVGLPPVSLDSLGVASLRAPLAFDQSGKLLAAGRLKSTAAQEAEPGPLLRCDLAAPACEAFAPALTGVEISALAVHPIDGSLFIADSSGGELIRLDAGGEVISRAGIDLPPQPVLRLNAGLLMINSALGPGISIYRYEENAFGKQLDEVLLLPDTDGSVEFSGVSDFLRNGDFWWAILEPAAAGDPGLYRFDNQWRFVDHPPLPADFRPRQLARWGGRTLVRDAAQLAVQRFNSTAEPEAPLVSRSLTQLQEEREHNANLIQLGWRIALALTLLAAVTSLCLGGLHQVRSLVYTSCRERGAAPVDELADNIDWVDVAQNRDASFGRTGIGYLALATGLVLGAIGLGASSIQLAALLLALAGPAAALILLQRSDPGHIGVGGEQLLLVDHDGMYHFDGGGRIHYRGPFLMIDDVTVFTGALLLPAFSPAQIREQVQPVARGGVRVDRKILTVKLLQARHPLAVGAVVILATSASAIALLSLHGIF